MLSQGKKQLATEPSGKTIHEGLCKLNKVGSLECPCVRPLRHLAYQFPLYTDGGTELDRTLLLTNILHQRMRKQWIRNLENCGSPSKVEHAHQATELLVKSALGANWITRFLDRHPQLAAKPTTPMERARMEATSALIIQGYFAKLGQAVKSKDIKKPGVYNMDEQGFLMRLAVIKSDLVI